MTIDVEATEIAIEGTETGVIDDAHARLETETEAAAVLKKEAPTLTQGVATTETVSARTDTDVTTEEDTTENEAEAEAEETETETGVEVGTAADATTMTGEVEGATETEIFLTATDEVAGEAATVVVEMEEAVRIAGTVTSLRLKCETRERARAHRRRGGSLRQI